MYDLSVNLGLGSSNNINLIILTPIKLTKKLEFCVQSLAETVYGGTVVIDISSLWYFSDVVAVGVL